MALSSVQSIVYTKVETLDELRAVLEVAQGTSSSTRHADADSDDSSASSRDIGDPVEQEITQRQLYFCSQNLATALMRLSIPSVNRLVVKEVDVWLVERLLTLF